MKLTVDGQDRGKVDIRSDYTIRTLKEYFRTVYPGRDITITFNDGETLAREVWTTDQYDDVTFKHYVENNLIEGGTIRLSPTTVLEARPIAPTIEVPTLYAAPLLDEVEREFIEQDGTVNYPKLLQSMTDINIYKFYFNKAKNLGNLDLDKLLRWAVGGGDKIDLIRFLVENGANITRGILHLADTMGNRDIVDYLRAAENRPTIIPATPIAPGTLEMLGINNLPNAFGIYNDLPHNDLQHLGTPRERERQLKILRIFYRIKASLKDKFYETIRNVNTIEDFMVKQKEYLDISSDEELDLYETITGQLNKITYKNHTTITIFYLAKYADEIKVVLV